MQEMAGIRERIPQLVNKFKLHESNFEGKLQHFIRIVKTAVPHVFGKKVELAFEATSITAETVAKGLVEGLGMAVGIPSPTELVDLAEDVKSLVEGAEGFDRMKATKEIEAHRQLHREIPHKFGEHLAANGMWYLLRYLWQEEQDHPEIKTEIVEKSRRRDLARIFSDEPQGAYNESELEYVRREIGDIVGYIRQQVEARKAEWRDKWIKDHPGENFNDALMPVEVSTEQEGDVKAVNQRIVNLLEGRGREQVTVGGHTTSKEVYIFGKHGGGEIHNVILTEIAKPENQFLREKALEGAVEAAGEFIVHQDNKLARRIETEEVRRMAKAMRSLFIGTGIPLTINIIKKVGEYALIEGGVIKVGVGIIAAVLGSAWFFWGVVGLTAIAAGASFSKGIFDLVKDSSSIRALKEEKKDLMEDVENVIGAVLQYYEGKHHAIKELNYHKEAKSLSRRNTAIGPASHHPATQI